MNEERLEHARTFCLHAQSTPAREKEVVSEKEGEIVRKRERDTDRERDRDRERERQRQRLRELQNMVIELTGALAPFIYLVETYL